MPADINKYYWMRYASDRGTNIALQGGTIKIAAGDLFGVREVRGKDFDEVMLRSGKTYKLAINKSEILMNRSKEFRGKVVLKPESPAAKKTPAKQKVVIAPSIKKQQDSDKRYARLLAKNGGMKLAAVKKTMAELADDAERIDFKRWALAQHARGSVPYEAIT